MSFSGGRQLPLSAFFHGSSSSAPANTRQPKVATKRKSSEVDLDEVPAPPKKRHTQKENVTPLRSKRSDKIPQEQTSTSSAQSTRRTRKRFTADKGYGFDISTAGAETPLERSSGPITYGPDDDPAGVRRTTSRLATPPVTPRLTQRYRDDPMEPLLPSPPLTAPGIKRPTRKCESEEGRDQTVTAGSSSSGRALPRADAVVNNTPAITPSSHGSLMPPRLPPEQGSSSVTLNLSPGHLQKPPFTDSDRWVPSSQTQELSIPRYQYYKDSSMTDDVPHAHRDRSPEIQVVPSSQISEIELELPTDAFDRVDEYPKLLPLQPLASHGKPTDLGDMAAEREIHSPKFVASSQSQIETEITAEMAEEMAARIVDKGKGLKEMTTSQTPSSSPRSTETQEYDANDEFSSQDTYSQPSTFAMSAPRTSPLRVPLHSADSGNFDISDSQPCSRTPTPVHRFRETFQRWDKRADVLPVSETEPRSRPSSPAEDSLDEITGSPLPIPDRFPDDTSSYSSSFPESLATPVKNFYGMFSQSEDDPSQL